MTNRDIRGEIHKREVERMRFHNYRERELNEACTYCGADVNEVCKNSISGEDVEFLHHLPIVEELNREVEKYSIFTKVLVVIDWGDTPNPTLKIVGVYRELSDEKEEEFNSEGYEIYESELK